MSFRKKTGKSPFLLKAYFAAKGIHQSLSAYEGAGFERAERGGDLVIDPDVTKILEHIAAGRRSECRTILRATPEEQAELANIDEIHTVSGRFRGVMFGHPLSRAESRMLKEQEKIFRQNWKGKDSFRAFTIVSFYYQPFELPLQKNIKKLSAAELARYLYFVMRQPHIMQESDEEKYIDYYRQMTDWLLEIIKESDSWEKSRQGMLLNLIKWTLTFGACYYVDRPTGDLVRARGRIVKALRQRTPSYKKVRAFRPNAAPAKGRTRLRLGILSRNIGDYTDTRALYAMFGSFDPKRYEIYWYSLDVVDPTTVSDVEFFRKLYGFIYKTVSLRGDGAKRARQILEDDLDILAVGTAYSFGAQDFDQMLSCRLARVQVNLNGLVPGSSGFSSYDYFVVPGADAASLANYRAESTETLKITPDPSVWYEKQPAVKPDREITRAKLGIPHNAVLYCASSAANKLMPGTLRTWLNILRKVPGSYLMLCPFNPAWGGYYIGLTFLARLRALLEQYPDIDSKRIVIIRQMTPDESVRVLMQSDVYLGIFPHGGATTAITALRYGIPMVARKSRWLRSTSDPSIVRSLGLEELIGEDNGGVTAIAARLGLDRAYRNRVKRLVAERVEQAPFFNHIYNSRRLQAVFDEMAVEKGLIKAQSFPRILKSA
ncbi:MAG: hypothetical protein PHY92_02350 [Alphaproteobacteria bacterium]|nr:hypothetical protein [Alphaproteobacteria bacterium]